MIKNWTFIKIVTHRSKKINKIKLNKMQETEQRDIIITNYEKKKKKKKRNLESSQKKKKKKPILYIEEQRVSTHLSSETIQDIWNVKRKRKVSLYEIRTS